MSTLAFIIERIIFLIIFTNCHILTLFSIPPSLILTTTRIYFWIPYLPIFTIFLNRNTSSIRENFSFTTKALSSISIPNFSSNTRVWNTIISIPNCYRLTFTSISILIPDHSSMTLLNHNTKMPIPLSSNLANTWSSLMIPYFSIHTLNTNILIPMKIFRTITFMSLYIPSFFTTTFRLNHTCLAIPILSLLTNTKLKVLIIDTTTSTFMIFFTKITIPSKASLTKAFFLYRIPCLSIYTLNTNSTIKI